MSQLIISIFAFIVALGVLVAFHEFGHFWVARKLGVKVLRFSLGFGKVIWRYQKHEGETEYVLSALPLGGYVKMLGEQDEDFSEHERHRAFSIQPAWKRIAIVAAGPVFNFLLAVLLYIFVFLIGIPDMKPVIQEVEPDSYAALAGFQPGDTITAIDSEAISGWQDARLQLLERILQQDRIAVSVVTETGARAERILSIEADDLLQEQGEVISNLGMLPWQPVIQPIFAEIQAGSAAERAGLQPGDRIVSTDNKPVQSWKEWVDYIRSHPEQKINLTLLREGVVIETVIIPEAKNENDKTIGFIGASVDLQYADAEWEEMRIIVAYPLHVSILRGMEKTWDMTMLSFRMIGKLITGNASPKNISGPITIAEYAGKTFSIDFRFFLDFLAIVSIGLAVLNILPVPVLDGGHLLYYVVELLLGRPLPEKIQLLGQNIGIVLLVCLMSLAFYNDITRLIG